MRSNCHGVTVDGNRVDVMMLLRCFGEMEGHQL